MSFVVTLSLCLTLTHLLSCIDLVSVSVSDKQQAGILNHLVNREN